MRIRALSWNVFHGRDFPPDPALRTMRSRILRLSERGKTHAGVNRDLRAEFTAVLAGASWDVALLQEFPPRWSAAVARACGADAHSALTSRNSLGRLRAAAARLNPDLIASNEGGSNLSLVRPAAGAIVERRELVLCRGPWPERRVMAFTRVRSDAGELCLGNLQASTGAANRPRAEDELRLAAERSLEWAAGAPLVLGGDLNVRPRDSSIYSELERRFALAPPTAPDSLDHLLARGLDIVQPPRAWRATERDVADGGLRIRLSDHAPVVAVFARLE